MYLVFDETLSEVAHEVFAQIQSQYNYSPSKRGTLSDVPETLDEALVVITNLQEFRQSPNYRRTALTMMSKGVIFFTNEEIERPRFEDEFAVSNPHFVNFAEQLEGLDWVEHAITTGKYAESKARFFQTEFPKVDYVGVTFADPIAIVVLGATRKEPAVDMRNEVANALPEDFWGSVAYVSSYRTETLNPLLEHLAYSSVLTVDKKMTDRVESLGRAVHNIGTPDGTVKYGTTVRNTVETQE